MRVVVDRPVTTASHGESSFSNWPSFRIARVHQCAQFAVQQCFAASIHFAANDGNTARECFKVNNSKSFAFAWHGKNVTQIVVTAQLVIGHVAGKNHVFG